MGISTFTSKEFIFCRVSKIGNEKVRPTIDLFPEMIGWFMLVPFKSEKGGTQNDSYMPTKKTVNIGVIY